MSFSQSPASSAPSPLKLYIAVVAVGWVVAAVAFTQTVAWGLPLVGYLMGMSVGALLRRYPIEASEPSTGPFAMGAVIVAALLARGSIFAVTANKYGVPIGEVFDRAGSFAYIGPIISAAVAASVVRRNLQVATMMASQVRA